MTRATTKRARRLWSLWLIGLLSALAVIAPSPVHAQTSDSDDQGPTGDSQELNTPTPTPVDVQITPADPLDIPATFTSTGKDDDKPYTDIILRWEWTFSDSDFEWDEDSYRMIVDYSRDEPGEWFEIAADPRVTQRNEVDGTTGLTDVHLSAVFRHDDLRPGQTYYYRVSLHSYHEGRSGPWSTTGPVSTEALPALPAPTGFTAVPAQGNPQNAIFLYWDPLPDESDEYLKTLESQLMYNLEGFNPQTEVWETVRFGLVETNLFHSGRVPGHGWEYRLYAVRHYTGLGDALSEAVTATVQPNEPPPPSGLTATPDANTPWQAVAISWDHAPHEAGVVRSYHVEFRKAGSGDDKWAAPFYDGPHTYNNTHVLDGLDPSTTWEYRVRTVREGRWHTHTKTSDWVTVTVATADIGGL